MFDNNILLQLSLIIILIILAMFIIINVFKVNSLDFTINYDDDEEYNYILKL